jgi:hypothetical protein
MKLPRSVRLLLALGVVVLGLAALLLILTIGDAVFSIDARLAAYPRWIAWAWWGGLSFIGLAVGWLAWRLLVPRPSAKA